MTADIERCRIPFEQALKDAGISKGELNHVILVGGSTRMPAGAPTSSETHRQGAQQVGQPRRGRGLGAAVQAGVLKGDVKDILLLDVTPLSLASRPRAA
jgi:molecular chaperone DnaK